MLTAHRCTTYPPAMEQVQARAMPKAATAKDRVDSALSRLESMVDERLRAEELAAYVDEKVGELRKQLPGAPEIKLMVFASLILADESREARGMAKAAESARASATDSAETLATALEDLITSRVDKMSKKVSGAA